MEPESVSGACRKDKKQKLQVMIKEIPTRHRGITLQTEGDRAHRRCEISISGDVANWSGQATE